MSGAGAGVLGVHHPGGGGRHLQQVGLRHGGGPGLPLVLPPHEKLESEGGDDEAQQSSAHHVLRVVLVVRDSGQGGVHRQQSAAHLNEGLDETEVAGVHPLLDVDHTEPHGVGRQTGVARGEAEPHLVKSVLSLPGLEVLLPETVELGEVVRTVPVPTLGLGKGDVGVTHRQEVRPQSP